MTFVGGHGRPPRQLGTVAASLAAMLIYWLAGRLALLMAIPPGYATAVWPAAGLAVVCVLVWGVRVAPGLAMGSMLVNIGTSFDGATMEAAARSIAVAATIGAGAALQASVAASLVRRSVGFPTALEDGRQVLRFLAFAGPVASVVSCTVGTLTLLANGTIAAGELTFHWFTWWTGDTIGVLVFAPLALLVVPLPDPVWKRRRLVMGATLAIGVLFVTALFVRASAWERDRLRTELDQRAGAVASVLRSQLSKYEEIASSLVSYFDASREVTRDGFRAFCARSLANHAGLLALSWDPIVEGPDRARVEAEARADGLDGFTFKELASDGSVRAASARARYVPIFFIEPRTGNERALGLDLLADPARREALERAARSGNGLATSSRVELVQFDPAADARGGILLIAPVVRSTAGAAELRGYVVAVFSLDALIGAALREVDHAGMAIVLRNGPGGTGAVLYRSKEPPTTRDVAASTLGVTFGDRHWELSIAPSAAAVAGQRSWQAWLVLARGMLFLGLLGAALLITTGSTSRIEALSTKAIASEAKYRALYEDSPDMYLTVEQRDGGAFIVDCNQTLCERLGYEKAELIGAPAQTVYSPEDVARAADRAAAFQQSGEFTDVERTLRTKDGRSIEVSLNLRAIRAPDGAIAGARAVWRDISRRKQVERDQQFLVQLGETLRSSADVEDVLSAVAAQLGTYLGVSRAAFVEVDAAQENLVIRSDYHRDVPSVSGTVPLSAFNPELIEGARQGHTIVIADAAADPRTAPGHERVYGLTGTRAMVTVPLLRAGRLAVLLTASHHEARAWQDREVTLVELVAERVWSWVEHLRVLAQLRTQAVESAVHQSEARFRALVAAINDYAIIMLDQDGCVASWNEGAARMTGYTAAEIVGRDVAVFQTAEDRAARRTSSILDHVQEHGRYAAEVRRVRKDGTLYWADVVITPMFDRAGTLEGYAKIMRDVTERRSRDEVLRQTVKEREVLLQEVHHRVKNNLQVISSLISMQARRLEAGSARDALDECKSRVSAIALIHEKLYQSRDYAQVPFSDYARSLATNVFHAAGVRPQDVELDLDIENVPLGVDRAIPCGLIINELISNALKHGLRDRTRGTIRVTLRRAAGGRLRLSVSDDGVGLPPGFALESSSTMGLQLVRTLARQLGADVSVRGEAGATFELEFPGVTDAA